eukprot:4305431-Pleurochrysis_carterae.AAC.1
MMKAAVSLRVSWPSRLPSQSRRTVRASRSVSLCSLQQSLSRFDRTNGLVRGPAVARLSSDCHLVAC